MNIELCIDELALHGFDPAACAAIAAAAERALTQLLAARGVPTALLQESVVAQRDGGTFTIALFSSPEAIGTQVAQALYGALEL